MLFVWQKFVLISYIISSGHKMNWDKYQRLDVIYGYMDYLAQTYPNLVTVGVIGNSYEGRPIKYIRISSGKPNPNVFVIDGGKK